MNNHNIPDQLALYRGLPHRITEDIPIRAPTLEEICAYGEADYFSMVQTLCSVGIDLCWQLEQINIPFDKISDYELFCTVLRNYYGVEQTKILFGDTLDLKHMELFKDENGGMRLEQKVQADNGITKTITLCKKDYHKLAACLRSLHHLKRNDAIAGTNSCRMAFIEDAKMEYEARRGEPRRSYLMPLISAMVNHEGFKRNDQTVWNMNIYAFMDSVRRIDRIRNSSLLLQSGYSGFGIDLKKIKKEELNYMGELN